MDNKTKKLIENLYMQGKLQEAKELTLFHLSHNETETENAAGGFKKPFVPFGKKPGGFGGDDKPSEPQLKFLKTLLDEKEHNENVDFDNLTKKEASDLINKLNSAPKKSGANPIQSAPGNVEAKIAPTPSQLGGDIKSASQKQKDLITDLLSKRDHSDNVEIDKLSSYEASSLITKLFSAPKKSETINSEKASKEINLALKTSLADIKDD